jgi:hypothetical protein
MFIPDPNFFHPGSRIHGQKDSRIQDPAPHPENLSILTQTIVSKLSEIWSKIFIPDPDLDFLPIPDPGFTGQEGTEFRIRIRTIGSSRFLKCMAIYP